MARRKPDQQPMEMGKLMTAVDARLSEFVDSYVFIAITADGRPIEMRKEINPVQRLALRALVADHVMGRHDES